VTFTELRSLHSDLPRVEVEIGCGNGHFLAEYAPRNPRTFLIGVEVKSKRCAKAREKADKRGLANVTIIRATAEGFIQDIPASSIDAFHIYFPDPWPKSRHRKRRFVSGVNLDRLHACLARGGRIFFSTDFFDYYVQVKILLLAHGGFLLMENPIPEEAFTSIYSRKSVKAKKTIQYIAAVKC
jgi:tRNA (guanine-N7-)-methyltransferase